jgi:predicted nucleotidyltransferase
MSKTASDLKNAGWPPDQIDKYRPWQAIERYGEDKGLIALRARALVIAQNVADFLKENFGATRVILFGSLAHGAWFTPRSDIDLYAEGIEVDVFLKSDAAIQEIGEGFKVDLVEPRECSPELLKRIVQEGIELWVGGRPGLRRGSGTNWNKLNGRDFTFGDHLPSGETWHKDLLLQMSKEIPGIRPALLSRDTVYDLEEFMRFRHRIRNIYSFNLVPERIKGLVERSIGVFNTVKSDLDDFVTFLEKLS